MRRQREKFIDRQYIPGIYLKMHFEWDERKNQLNSKNHGIDFETTVQCWGDSAGFDVWDEKHSNIEEERWLRFGKLLNGKIICVVYTELSEEHIRIISAFSGKKIEVIYYEGQNIGK